MTDPPRIRIPADFRALFDEAISPTGNQYLVDPVSWARDKLGAHLWSKQAEFIQSVADHRYTAVPSCHGVGKSFGDAIVASWWLDVHPPGEAFVVSTAPTTPQIGAILWREMRSMHQTGKLNGRITLANEWYIQIGDTEHLVGYGRKPGEHHQSQAFQGIHARYVLVILDEACGIPKWLFDAADTLATNENARVLATGNPDDSTSQFKKVCEPGSGWNVVPISAVDTPNFTDEPIPEMLRELLISKTWVQERKQRWGEKSPIYQSKVLGVFPEISDHNVFTPTLIRRCHELELDGLDKGTRAFDIARMGDNLTVGYHNRGGHCRMIYEQGKQEFPQTSGEIKILAETMTRTIPNVIDCDGIGIGVYDILNEQGVHVIQYRGGMPPIDRERFVNKRAESYWTAREMMEEGLIDLDPLDDALASQLLTIRYYVDSRGRIGIESKQDSQKRGIPSPDHADAFVMSIASHDNTVYDVSPQMGMLTKSLTGDLLDREL